MVDARLGVALFLTIGSVGCRKSAPPDPVTELARYQQEASDLGFKPSPPPASRSHDLWKKVYLHPLFKSAEFRRPPDPDLELRPISEIRKVVNQYQPLIKLMIEAAMKEQPIVAPGNVPADSDAALHPTEVDVDKIVNQSDGLTGMVAFPLGSVDFRSLVLLQANAKVVVTDQGRVAGLVALLPIAKMIGFVRADPRHEAQMRGMIYTRYLQQTLQDLFDMGPLDDADRRVVAQIAECLGHPPSPAEVFWSILREADTRIQTDPARSLAQGMIGIDDDGKMTSPQKQYEAPGGRNKPRAVIWKHGVMVLKAMQTTSSIKDLSENLTKSEVSMGAETDPIVSWMLRTFDRVNEWTLNMVQQRVLDDLLTLIGKGTEAEGKAMDRYSGRPLRYVVKDHQAILYSVGSDFIDDGGKATSDPIKGGPQGTYRSTPTDFGFRLKLK